MDIKIIALFVTVLLAITGYLYNYSQQIASERRKERLNLLNKQINEFYGPLYILTESSSAAFSTLRHRLGGIHVFKNSKNPTAKELEEWHIWVVSVFVPLNEKIENTILNNAHLIRERDIPSCLLKFISHSITYKSILYKWDSGDIGEFLSPVEFPKELHDYANRSYQSLKEEQVELIGRQ